MTGRHKHLRRRLNLPGGAVVMLILILTSWACKKQSGFLDRKGDAPLNEQVVFADSALTMDFLTGIYIGADFNIQSGAVHNTSDFERLTDLAEGRYPATGNFDKQVTQGVFGPNFYSKMATEWNFLYAKIRNVNIFLHNAERWPLSVPLKIRLRAEARFLRAWYYHYLIRYFGGVPLLGDRVYAIEDQADLSRSTFGSCMSYLVSELDAIKSDLPLAYAGDDYGRVTRGAVLALKSRILVMAASPLFNGGSISADPDLAKLTAYPTVDANRWVIAREAAKEVIDLGRYELMSDNATRPGNGFYKLFLTRVNSEFIFSRQYPSGKIMEISHNPKSRGGAWYFDYPTQELVDMFPMANGRPIVDPLSGYDPAEPYRDRDPRFGFTVMYNGSLYFLNTTKALAPVYTYSGGSDGIVAISSNTGTVTGYFHRKMCDEYAAVSGGNNVDRAVPLIRYAEVLLDYAEACNESGQPANALAVLRSIRERAGIQRGNDGLFGLPAAPSTDQLRQLIQNERAIELAFEGHRFWDLRRWKAGAQLDGRFVHGMSISLSGSKYTYQPINIRTRYFKDNLYLFPIPITELNLNPSIRQNPGW
ncbi:RagB/SusD family nutrient uptake outer membrane protein [Hufsiella ginkgonis]|uniref:RagB/SusD family nutrient uptake outer membrane protein n=1 Tax=Hufsiella ginkgonis TaxID=2695274 RepID=A0A7K1XS21_9SPHI|nr:RagB/SusD family nutrient uptake outer membrane protein [Hufsiella ginkgonis]MXV13768.1 RagB/SusD family nutrient uptake outer membrane protein [Hufsiella ginkgonis]